MWWTSTRGKWTDLLFSHQFIVVGSGESRHLNFARQTRFVKLFDPNVHEVYFKTDKKRFKSANNLFLISGSFSLFLVLFQTLSW